MKQKKITQVKCSHWRERLAGTKLLTADEYVHRVLLPREKDAAEFHPKVEAGQHRRGLGFDRGSLQTNEFGEKNVLKNVLWGIYATKRDKMGML